MNSLKKGTKSKTSMLLLLLLLTFSLKIKHNPLLQNLFWVAVEPSSKTCP